MSIACPSFIAGINPGLCRPIDHYCERLSPSWDAEPVNTLTNLAFVLAGYLAWRFYSRRHNGAPDRLIVALIVTTPIVGIGSMFFHAFATRWLEWGDVFPILIFMLLYLWFVLRRFLAWRRLPSAVTVFAFVGVTYSLEARVPGDVLWGGAMYVPTMVAFLVFGLAILRSDPVAGRGFLIAAAMFLVSFAARTADEPLCPTVVLGTHFLWHLLNGLLLWLLILTLIRHGRAPLRAPAPA